MAKDSSPKIDKKIEIITTEKVNSFDLFIKEWNFRCVNCGCISQFTASNIIFKEVSFYCIDCGTNNTIRNPNFFNGNQQ